MFEVSGPRDVRLLRACLAELMRRHESLRTSFRFLAGEPKQVIAPAEAGEGPLTEHDPRRGAPPPPPARPPGAAAPPGGPPVGPPPAAPPPGGAAPAPA